MDGKHKARVGRECIVTCLKDGWRATFDNLHKADEFLGYAKGYVSQKRAKGIDTFLRRKDHLLYKIEFGEVKRLYPVAQSKPKEKMISESSFNYTPQLCWTCKKACGGCCWSAEFIPIPNWIAVPTIIKNSLGDGKGDLHSYRIISCPEYKKG